MKTAVIYARYSCDNQTEQSIEGQLRVCEEYAKKNDILILRSYIDRAMTGTNDNRPEFRQMIKDSFRKEWNYVIVYKLDRFSRDKYETAIHKNTLKSNGVKVMSAMENIPDSPEGIILESLLEGMNQYFSAELSQKVKRGMRETRLKGNFQGGKILFGYKVVNHKILVDDERAEVVRYIFGQYANGVVVKDIIKSLTSKCIFYKGKPFAKNTVYGILYNSKYSGVYVRANNEVVDNMYPQIVPTELYNKVRSMLDKNKYGRKSVTTVYLLKHKAFCGLCGKPVSAESGTARNGEKKTYYKCRGRKQDHSDCQLQPIRQEYLEKLVINTTVNELCKPQVMDEIVKHIMELQNQQAENDITLQLLNKEKASTDRALQNILEAIENGIYSTTTNKRLHELEARQVELEKQILLEKSKIAMKVPESIVRQFYKEALTEEAKTLITLLIKRVTVYNDRVEIEYNSPLRTSPDIDGQGFIFSQKVFRMGNYTALVLLKV